MNILTKNEIETYQTDPMPLYVQQYNKNFKTKAFDKINLKLYFYQTGGKYYTEKVDVVIVSETFGYLVSETVEKDYDLTDKVNTALKKCLDIYCSWVKDKKYIPYDDEIIFSRPTTTA